MEDEVGRVGDQGESEMIFGKERTDARRGQREERIERATTGAVISKRGKQYGEMLMRLYYG